MNKLQRNAILLTRLSLGIIFLWFGSLKLFASGDGLSILQNALPHQLAFSQIFSFIIAFSEIVIGLSFLTHKYVRPASVIAFFYLLITALLILVSQGFDPRFPVLSEAGESSLKNLVLAAATLILLSEQTQKQSSESVEKQLKP